MCRKCAEVGVELPMLLLSCVSANQVSIDLSNVGLNWWKLFLCCHVILCIDVSQVGQIEKIDFLSCWSYVSKRGLQCVTNVFKLVTTLPCCYPVNIYVSKQVLDQWTWLICCPVHCSEGVWANCGMWSSSCRRNLKLGDSLPSIHCGHTQGYMPQPF